MNNPARLILRGLVAVLVFTGLNTQAQITVTQDLTVEEYVNDILLGEGVTASNITITGSEAQIGLLEGGSGTIFPVDAGLVLSCDNAMNIDPDGGFGTIPIGEAVSGDQDLLDIANSVPPLIGQTFSVSSVNDISAIEFDFVATGDTVSFNYVFGSDEYLTYVNTQYNDIFAFFLSGPGLVGPYDSPVEFPDGAINIAQVPDTDPPLPITISSVNNVSYDEYYTNNPANTDIGLNGFTSLFTASSAVTCGETYHIKLAIADGTDTALESVVVLESGSFASNNPAVISSEAEVQTEIDLPDATILEGCVNGSFLFTINAEDLGSDTLFFSVGGDAINGTDYELINDYVVIDDLVDGAFELFINSLPDDLDEGAESVEITYIYTNSCGWSDTTSAMLSIVDLTPLNLTANDLFICPGDTETSSADISGGIPDYSYTWTNGDNGANASFDHGEGGTYTVEASDLCEQTVSATITVEDGSVLNANVPEDWYCIGLETAVLFTGGVDPVEFSFNDDYISISGNGQFGSNSEGQFAVTASDNCDQEITLDLEFVVCDTTIPNVFTPGNDQANDFFVIDGISGFPNSSLTVFNRWGNVIYESSNYDNKWAGLDSNGNELAQGTYYYVFERSDGEGFAGDVIILR